jgi:hypothetical protein
VIHCAERGCHCPSGVCVVQARPERWAVVWWAPERHEAHFGDRALAEAYASAHHGEVVSLVALRPMPGRRRAPG